MLRHPVNVHSFLLLLFFQMSACTADETNNINRITQPKPAQSVTPVKDACDPFANQMYKAICSDGLYTRELKLKYKDRRVDVGVRFSIFALSSQSNNAIIWFYDKNYKKCTSIKFSSDRKLTCYSRLRRIYEYVPPDQFYCIDFRIQYATDLLKLCISQGKYHLSRQNTFTFVGLLYVGATTTRSNATIIGENNGLYVALTTVAVFLIALLLKSR